MESSQDSFKLNYFPVNGKASMTRAILYYTNTPFEDNKITFEDWGKFKKSGDFEFEQLPMLEWNGLKMVQSAAIVLTLARKFGLVGSTLEQEYLHTSLLSSLDDINPKFYPAAWSMTPEGQADIKNKETEYLEIHAPFFLGVYEARFKKYGGKFAVGDSFSLSDIFFTCVLQNQFRNPARKELWEPVLLKHAPTLAAHVENIAKNELASFFEKGFINQVPI